MGAEADAMGDTQFYLEPARESAAQGHSVLELACGTGRVTLPNAREGIEVVGLDNAAAMLDIARRKASSDGIAMTWVEADMRDFDLARRFGLMIMPYRSFLHLLTDADQRSCLDTVLRHLKPRGRFALNFFAPPFAAFRRISWRRPGHLTHPQAHVPALRLERRNGTTTDRRRLRSGGRIWRFR